MEDRLNLVLSLLQDIQVNGKRNLNNLLASIQIVELLIQENKQE